MNTNRSILALGAILLGLSTAKARGDFTYLVTVDASAIAPNTSGYLDFQFNPGGSESQAASATVTNFRSSGLTLGALDLNGQATAPAPFPSGSLVLGNADALNEGLQAVTFGIGCVFSFDVTLGGPAVNSPDGLSTAGTEFSLGVLDSMYDPLLPISSPVDPLVTVDIAPITGSLTATSFAPLVAAIAPSPVPAPASISLLFLGLAIASVARVRPIERAEKLVGLLATLPGLRQSGPSSLEPVPGSP